jgi:short-subunit dehydrogenase
MELNGKRIWLIGASTGIGAELAPQLAAKGARLALSARSEDELRQVASQSGDAIVKPLDVTDGGAMERVANALRSEWGAIDVLIYNAGAWEPTDVARFDVDAFEKQIDVNYRGMMRAIAAVLPDMIAQRSGEIVGVASLSAYGAFPRAEAYGSTKAAVNYMLQALRMDLRRRGIGVTTVNPGFVRTELTARNDFPMPFLMQPGDAARTIVEGLEAGRTEIHFPRRLSWPLKLLTALPRPVYEFLVSKTSRG